MLLDELVGVIEALKQRIRTHGATLRANEIRTRVALIDPLLVALGWDVSDPALVTPEYAVGEGRADYALHGSESIPAAMVEAKRLGHALNDDERMQMLNYANARGVRYAAVTDGDVWEFYEVFKQAPLEDRRLLNLRIANTPAHELALRLLLLWRPNLASGQPMTANQPILGNVSPTTPTIPVDTQPPTTTGKSQASPGSSESESLEWTPLTDFNPPGGTAPPQVIRFPGGRKCEIKRWNDLLVEVATWLSQTGRLTVRNIPVQSSATIYIVHNEPVHSTGNRFSQYKEIPDAHLVVNTHGSAVQMRNNAKKLLEHCGVDPATVHLQVGQ